MRTVLLATLAILFLAVIAVADVVHMKDGRKLKGKIVGETDNEVILKMPYGQMKIPWTDIERIEKTGEMEPLPKEEPPEPPPSEDEPGETAEEPPEEPAKPVPKTPEKTEVFTVDDWLAFEKKFAGYSNLDEETRLRRLLEWKKEYRGRRIVIKAKVVAIRQEVVMVLTDEGEKPLTTLYVKVHYFDLRGASDTQSRKRLWGGTNTPMLDFEYDIPKIRAGRINVGDFVHIGAAFPLLPTPVGAIGDFFGSLHRLEAGGKAIAEHEKCTGCRGTGRIACEKCRRSGFLKCRGCDGRGIVKCVLCNGTGTVEPGSKACSRCGGEGRHECRLCSGQGKTKCTECSGTGEATCPKCYGSGRK